MTAQHTWQMPLLIRLSLLLHAVLALAIILYPQTWPWTFACFVANHLLMWDPLESTCRHASLSIL